MDISSRDLRLVVALDDHRHFGRAAESLGFSQPALSRALKGVEERIGQALFVRSRSGVEPTDVGRLVAERGRRLLSAFDDLQREVTMAQDRGIGELSVGVGHYPAELTVAAAVGRLLDARPLLNFSLRTQEWLEIADALMRREVDLAFCETSPFEDKSDYRVIPVGAHLVYFYTRSDHPLARKPSPSLEDLLRYPWAGPVLPWRAARFFPETAGACPAGGLDAQRRLFVPRVTVTSMHLAMKIVNTSQCVAISTLSQLANGLNRGDLSLLRHREPWMQLNYGFVHLIDRPPGQSSKEFMAFILEEEQALVEREQALRERFWESGQPDAG
jgi:DNA-binding transcriptional LysR family regulator